MTKIDQINERIAMQATKRPSALTPTLFKTSLENALSRNIPDNIDRGQASALYEPQSPMIGQCCGASRADVVEQTDRLLGLLESYATGLEKPGTTLKGLASIVTQMRDEAMQLMASTDMHAAGESEINSIATTAALIANVEYIKFCRGDYV